MSDLTEQPPEQHSPTQPRPNPVFSEPATVDACRRDYEAGSDVRANLAAQDARARR